MIFLAEDWLLLAEDVCKVCGGQCCIDAHPPLSRSGMQRLMAAGVSPDLVEYAGYDRLKVKEDGRCILSEEGACRIHAVKPETCRAGPFTFDVHDDRIEIYLKYERICPLVKLLKATPEAYQLQYDRAVLSITLLVNSLSQDEITAVCSNDEPDTEKVAEIPWKSGLT